MSASDRGFPSSSSGHRTAPATFAFPEPGTASKTVTLPAGTKLVLRVRAWNCSQNPRMTVTLDGSQLQSVAISSGNYFNDMVPVSISAGSHTLAVGMTSGYYSSYTCGNSVHLDDVTVQ